MSLCNTDSTCIALEFRVCDTDLYISSNGVLCYVALISSFVALMLSSACNTDFNYVNIASLFSSSVAVILHCVHVVLVSSSTCNIDSLIYLSISSTDPYICSSDPFECTVLISSSTCNIDSLSYLIIRSTDPYICSMTSSNVQYRSLRLPVTLISAK